MKSVAWNDISAETQHYCRVSAIVTLLTSGTIFGASLRVSTQFIGHNVHMTGSEFATLAEIIKCLNINKLRKSVIGRNEATYYQSYIYRLLRSSQWRHLWKFYQYHISAKINETRQSCRVTDNSCEVNKIQFIETCWLQVVPL